MPLITICVGIPTSGKSFWAKKQDLYTKILSCDAIRTEINNGEYKFSANAEKLVWDTFYLRLRFCVRERRNIIIDNTNLRQTYIDEILACLTPDYVVVYKYFPISLHRAYWRNYIRYIKTGKWIPLKVIKNFHKRYTQLYGNS